MARGAAARQPVRGPRAVAVMIVVAIAGPEDAAAAAATTTVAATAGYAQQLLAGRIEVAGGRTAGERDDDEGNTEQASGHRFSSGSVCAARYSSARANRKNRMHRCRCSIGVSRATEVADLTSSPVVPGTCPRTRPSGGSRRRRVFDALVRARLWQRRMRPGRPARPRSSSPASPSTRRSFLPSFVEPGAIPGIER